MQDSALGPAIRSVSYVDFIPYVLSAIKLDARAFPKTDKKSVTRRRSAWPSAIARASPRRGITAQQSGNSEIKKVVAASMAGTVAEWYEFFIYGVASTLVFGPLFFPRSTAPERHHRRVRDLCRRLHRPAAGRHRLRPFRRPAGPQEAAAIQLAAGGVFHLPDGMPAGSRPSASRRRRCWYCCASSRASPWAGSGRGGAADRRTLAARPARLLGQLSAIGGLHRQCAGLDRAVRPVLAAVQGGLPGLGLARGLLAVRDHRFRRLLHSPFGGGRADFRGIYRRQKEARKKAASLRTRWPPIRARPSSASCCGWARTRSITIVVFSITYLTVHAKLPSQTVMFIMFIANIFQFFSMLFGGYLSDRIGRKACIALGYAGLLVWAFLYFPGLDSLERSYPRSHLHGVVLPGALLRSAGGVLSEIFRPRCAMPAHRSATRSRPSWPVRSRRWSRPCCCATTAAPDPS